MKLSFLGVSPPFGLCNSSLSTANNIKGNIIRVQRETATPIMPKNGRCTETMFKGKSPELSKSIDYVIVGIIPEKHIHSVE